jgi:AbrB family looped-hinge helix DNA binding protein
MVHLPLFDGARNWAAQGMITCFEIFFAATAGSYNITDEMTAGSVKSLVCHLKLTSLIDDDIVIPKTYRWRCGMQTVTVSPKYQVVIPKEIRETLRLRPGQKMSVIEYEGRIELIPDRDMSELRGFLRGIDTRIEREKDRV